VIDRVALKSHLVATTDLSVFVGPIHDSRGRAFSTITSVAAELQNVDTGVTVSSSNISLTLVSGETQYYEGTIPDSITLVPGTKYRVEYTIVADTLTFKGYHKATCKSS
jgi:hypothetical protein